MNNAASTEWHDGRIPDFVGPALDSLYGSLYSSLPQLALEGLQDACVYIARSAGRLQALFLYRCKGRSVRVINEGMRVSATQAAAFVQQLFRRMPAVGRIEFHAIDYDNKPSAECMLRFAMAEDIVIDLPDSEAAYLQRLGKATRKSLRQNLARAKPLVHQVIPGRDVGPDLVDQLISFNHARLEGKQRRSALDGVAASRLLELVRVCGMAGTVSVNGQLCAGTLACRIGDDVYSLVNAHDPAFDHLSMGNLSRHLMIAAAIRAGARRFHLLGGNFSSKRACGGERRVLHHLIVYRNLRQMVFDLPYIALLAWREQRYRVGTALEDDASPANTPPRQRWLPALARLLRDGRRTGLRWLRSTSAALR